EATRGGRHGAHFTDPPACSLARTQSEGAGRGTGPSGFDHRGDQGVPREEVSWERPGNKAATVMPAVMPKPTPFRDNWRRPARRAKENRPGNIGFPGRPVNPFGLRIHRAPGMLAPVNRPVRVIAYSDYL